VSVVRQEAAWLCAEIVAGFVLSSAPEIWSCARPGTGNCWIDAVSQQIAREVRRHALFGRPMSRVLARFVARGRDLIWRQPDDSAFPPHSDRIAVSFMALKGITNGRAERALNSVEITGPLGGSRARIRNGHACGSFKTFHASASATTVEAPKTRDATRRGLTTSALS
jgi:hypothetical protein